ncbi:MAG: MFS transporter [Anaerolineae bacterium]|nr:MFS transporter [Anaerolineae bacterium]
MKNTPRSRLLRPAIALRALYFLHYGSSASWVPFFNVYLQQLGLTGLQIGMLSGVRPAVATLIQPLWGLIADLGGRRRTLLWTALLSALATLGFIWTGSFWPVLVWMIVLAFLATPIGPLVDSLVLDYLELNRRASYGALRMWGAVGWAAMSFAVGQAIAGRDIRLTFGFGAGLMGLGWLLAARAADRDARSRALANRWRDLGPLLRNRKLLTFLTLVMLLQVGASSLFSFYSIYMTELGASNQLIGLAYGIQGISELPVYLIAAAVIRRIGAARAVTISFFLSAIRALLYSAISNPGLAAATQVMHGTFSLFLVASVEYVNELVPAEWRATGQSILSAAYFGLGSILGNTLAGLLYDRVGVQSMFRLDGFLILGVGLIAVWVLRAPAGAEL